MGEWLQRLGLERYEQGLLHNGWDDLEFLRYSGSAGHTSASPGRVSPVSVCSDITEEDLEEAGVLDPAHKLMLLESLRQQLEQQQK